MADKKRIVYAEDVLALIKRDRAYMTDVGRIHAICAVQSAPTVDAEPVVHGRWKYYHKQNIAVCTNCSFERDLDANFGKAVSCPNCSAKMDLPRITDQAKNALERMGQKAHGGAENGK